MQTTDFLDLLKERHGWTDYRIAKMAGVPANRLANYRMGRSRMDDEMAVRIAKLADLDVAGVLAAVHAERSTDPEAKAALLDVARERLGGLVRVALCGVMIGAGGLSYAPTAQASTQPATVSDLTHAIHYAQCRYLLSCCFFGYFYSYPNRHGKQQVLRASNTVHEPSYCPAGISIVTWCSYVGSPRRASLFF